MSGPAEPVDPGPSPPPPTFSGAAVTGPASPAPGESGTRPTPPAPSDLPGRIRDEGWAATVAQGLAVARWVAGEIAARRIEHLAWIAWIVGLTGLAFLGLSIPVDPGAVLIGLGVLCGITAVAIRLTLALGAAVMRRLALPRRARHLRPEVAAARARLVESVAETGFPVSIWSGVRFVLALAAGRRPHSGVPSRLIALSGRLGEVVEVERVRQALRTAASSPTSRRPRAGSVPPADPWTGGGPR